jgi:hypothetical protein
MNYLLQDQVRPPAGVGLPAVVILTSQGVQPNTAKGSACPTALEVLGGGQGAVNAAVAMLSMPLDETGRAAVTPAHYQRRAQLIQEIDQDFTATRPDLNVKAWTAAWQTAQKVTLQGKAATAFNLPSGMVSALTAAAPNARTTDVFNIALAQNLVLNGIPFVSCAITGNDTHTNNKAVVTLNWGETVDPLFTQLAQNFKAAGKRVLVVWIGDFGRTPQTVASGRDGRDHWPVGFSAGMLSVGQPAFRTNAVGQTGPDGMWTGTSTPGLVDMVYPGALGGMLYRAMGYPPVLPSGAPNPACYVPNTTGLNGSVGLPVDVQYQTSNNGGSLWLAKQFGIL